MLIKKSGSFNFFWSILALVLCIFGMLVYNNNKPNKGKQEIIEEESTANIVPYIQDTISQFGIQKIKLTVNANDYSKLKKKRDEARKASILISNDDDFVQAAVLFNNKNHQGKIRLKGDWTDHLEGEQWSFRVKLRADDTILGMRKFSLHKPKTRHHSWEWLFHQLLKDEGILNLQYHFAEVELIIKNSDGSETKELGLYAIEEAFDKHLVERNNRREGVLLKLDENPMWEERAHFIANYSNWEELRSIGISKEESLPVIPFGQKKVLQDSTLYNQFLNARTLFKSIFEKDATLEKVFDIKLLAKYNALCAILGANHAMIAHNYRVYYNPVTGLLEPVGFDANAGGKQEYIYHYFSGEKNPEYLKAYAQALEEVTSDEYFEKILNYPNLDKINDIIRTEIPAFKMNKSILKFNRIKIKKAINPQRCLNVFYDKIENNKIHLTVENYGKYPMEIVGLKQKGGRFFTKKKDEIFLAGKTRKTIQFDLVNGYNQIFTNVKKRKAGFSSNSDIPNSRLVYHTAGLEDLLKEEEIFAWSGKESDIRNLPILKKQGNIAEYPFLVVNEADKTITWKEGNWKLGNEMIVPPGYLFKIMPNTSIKILSNISRIISYSPIEFLGKENMPIKIYSENTKGQGLLVLNAVDTSRVEHCVFSGLSNPKTNGWLNTGSVNFYESPVIIKNSVIKNNHCEDALNIIRSYFVLDNVIFKNTKSDAFDGDFVEGVVKNCLFGDLGNDAIDVSGSKLIVDRVSIVNANDKGLSAGENSQIVASNIIIKNCEIAVASKDKSIVNLSDSFLKDNKLGFTAFQKKSEFGTASIIATNIKSENSELDYLIETNSSLKLNGVDAKTVDVVKDRMYGVDFGKKSE